MNRRKVLCKYFINDSFQSLFGGKRSSSLTKSVIAMMFVVLLMSLPFVTMVAALYLPFESIGQEGMLLSLMYFTGSTVILLFGIFAVLNIFYFSNDVETFLPMPFKTGDIIFAKFISAIINMFVYAVILVAPLVTYGVISKSGVMYYVYMIISLMLVVIFPLIIASLICIIIMRIVPLTKHKDAFKVVAGCLALCLVVGFNLLVQRFSNGNVNEEKMVQIISQGNNGAMKYIDSIFIVNRFSAKALLNASSVDGLINMLIAIIISVVLFGVYYLIGSRLYLKSVIGLSETYSSRNTELTRKSFSLNSPIKAIVLKDLKVVLRTPQFFINCVAMNIYMPAILVVCFYTNGSINNLRELVLNSGGKYDALLVAVIFLATSVFVSGGRMASSSLSREGRDFTLSKCIPVSYKVQTRAKIYCSLIVNSINIFIMAILIIVINMGFKMNIICIIVNIVTVVVITLGEMYFDYKSPNFEWEDEKQLFKGNYSSLVSLLILTVIGFAFIILSLFIDYALIMLALVLVIEIPISVLFYKKINKLSEKIYNN